MKKKLFAALLGAALFVNGLYLQQAYGSQNEKAELVCSTLYDLAYNTMIVRQIDVPKEDMVAQIKDVVTLPEAIDEALKLVDSAFEVPVVPSNDVEIIAVGFGKFHEQECVKKNSGIAL